MNKITIALATLVFSGTIFSSAEQVRVDNYSETFSRTLNTSDHAFAPRAWGHKVDPYQSPYGGNPTYVSYQQKSSGGWDGGAYISVGNHRLSSSVTTNDLLVTPELLRNAEVTFYAKTNQSYTTPAPSIELYACIINDDGSISVGAKLGYTIPALTSSWQKITINLDEEDRINLGIRLHYVDIDDFTASRAWPDYVNELDIQNVTGTSGTAIDSDSQGNFTVKVNATVKNIGDYALNSETNNYTLDLLDHATGAVLVSKTIDTALDLDDTSVQELSKTLNISEYPDGITVDVRENVSETPKVVAGPTFTVVPYEPLPAIMRQGNSTELSQGAVQYYGVSAEEVSKTFTLKNNGAALMTVAGITVPTGYELEEGLTFPLNIPAHATEDFTVKMISTPIGDHIGNLTVNINDAEDIILSLHGAVTDNSRWHEGFENGIIPNNYIANNWSVADLNNVYGLSGNTKTLMNGTSNTARLITPQFTASDGDAVHFSAAITTESSTGLKVYYSTDRQNWNLLNNFTTDATNENERLSKEILASNYGVYKRFAVNVPAGKGYLCFEGARIFLDDINGPELSYINHDLFFEDITVPATGMVNYDLTLKANLRNVTEKIEEANSYTLSLYVDDKYISKAESETLNPNELKEFTFNYTPHYTGLHNVELRVETKDGYVNSANGTINVAAEGTETSGSLGTANDESDEWPIDVTEEINECESIYPASSIGLNNGGQITSLSWKGNTSYVDQLDANITIWMENTDDNGYSNGATLKTTGSMTQVFSGTVTLQPVGTSDKDRISITLEQPFEYTGNSIRIRISSENDVLTGIMAMTPRSWWQTDATLASNTIHGTGGSVTIAESTPVVYFTGMDAASGVSGKVTIEGTDSPAMGAKVVATSGNVIYETTVKEDGTYTLPIYQNSLNYQLVTKMEGYMPVVRQVNISEGSVVENFTLSAADRVAIINASIPSEGVVNHPLQANVTLLNPLSETASDVEVILYLNEEETTTLTIDRMQPMEEMNVDLTFYPHSAGNLPAYVSILSNQLASTSNTTNINVVNEVGAKLQQIGTNSYRNTDIVNYMMNKYGMYEWYYTPEQLGISKGTKIHSLTLRGYSTATMTFNAKLYFANEDNMNLAANNVNPINNMELAAETTENIVRAGSTNATVDMITFTFDEPIVYEGGYLHFAMPHDGNGSMSSFSLEMDGTTNAQSASGGSSYDTAIPTSWTKNKRVPVAYIKVDDFTTVNGTVTDENDDAIEGASVRFISGGVEYSDVTNADGEFSFNVIQKNLEYEALVAAPGYVIYRESNAEMGENNYVLVYNLTFIPNEATTIVIPVDLNQNEVETAGEFYQFFGIDETDNSLKFIRVKQTLANTPYLFIPSTATPFDFASYDITNAVAGVSVANDNIFAGTYTNKLLVNNEDITYFTINPSDSNFVNVEDADGDRCPQFEAYIALPSELFENAQNVTYKLINDPVLGIGEAATETIFVVYNLQGIKLLETTDASMLNSLGKGIYIINGKKVFIR